MFPKQFEWTPLKGTDFLSFFFQTSQFPPPLCYCSPDPEGNHVKDNVIAIIPAMNSSRGFSGSRKQMESMFKKPHPLNIQPKDILIPEDTFTLANYIHYNCL